MKHPELDKAQELAGFITGSVGDMKYHGVTVQRSHRFPLHLYVYVRNIANASGLPESTVINQLLGAGVEAVTKLLPKPVAEGLALIPEELMKHTKTGGK